MWTIRKGFLPSAINTSGYYIDILRKHSLKFFCKWFLGPLILILELIIICLVTKRRNQKLIFSFSGYFDTCNEKACCYTFIISLKIYILFNTKSNWKSRPETLYNLLIQANFHYPHCPRICDLAQKEAARRRKTRCSLWINELKDNCWIHITYLA